MIGKNERDYIPIEKIVEFANPYIERLRQKKDLVIKESQFSDGDEAVYDIHLDSPQLLGNIKIWSAMTFHFEVGDVETGIFFLNLSAPYAVLDDLVPFFKVMERIYLG